MSQITVLSACFHLLMECCDILAFPRIHANHGRHPTFQSLRAFRSDDPARHVLPGWLLSARVRLRLLLWFRSAG